MTLLAENAEENRDEIDLGGLKASIRQEADQARRRQGSADSRDGNVFEQGSAWTAIAAGIHQAAQNSEVGDGLPPLRRLSGPARFLGRMLARGVLGVSRFLVKKQRKFNRAVVKVFHKFYSQLRQLEQKQTESSRQAEERFRKLEARCRHLELELTRLHQVAPITTASREGTFSSE